MKLLDADYTLLVSNYERAKDPKDPAFHVYSQLKSV